MKIKRGSGGVGAAVVHQDQGAFWERIQRSSISPIQLTGACVVLVVNPVRITDFRNRVIPRGNEPTETVLHLRPFHCALDNRPVLGPPFYPFPDCVGDQENPQPQQVKVPSSYEPINCGRHFKVVVLSFSMGLGSGPLLANLPQTLNKVSDKDFADFVNKYPNSGMA